MICSHHNILLMTCSHHNILLMTCSYHKVVFINCCHQKLLFFIYICSGCEQSYLDHTARKLLPGLAWQMFRPDYTCEEPERRLVRTPISVLVMLLVGLQRSGSSGSQQNTFSNLGGLNLLHPKVVDLAPPYSQHHAHALRYTSTLNYNSPVSIRWVVFW